MNPTAVWFEMIEPGGFRKYSVIHLFFDFELTA